MRVLLTTDTAGGVWTYAMELVLEAALSGCALVLSDSPSPREHWGRMALSYFGVYDAALAGREVVECAS
ncbi:MAG TPA: hypothetical protein VH764_12675 [Gemmatimonadales bacterium]|jgi:hypothetical protein